MGMPVNTPRAWRFGVFELDASSRELRRSRAVVKLREHPARILLLSRCTALTHPAPGKMRSHSAHEKRFHFFAEPKNG